jgi:hypothetical protein
MTTTNTKIELVTEAVEALVLASVIASKSADIGEAALNMQNLRDARVVLSSAFRELLTPTLRVVS